jgi:hypothetical protein
MEQKQEHPIIEDGKTLDELNGKDQMGAVTIRNMRAAGATDEEIWQFFKDN